MPRPRVNRRVGEQAIRVFTHTAAVKSVLPDTGFGLFPIPAQQHRAFDARTVHFTQQVVDPRESLHRDPIFAPSGT